MNVIKMTMMAIMAKNNDNDNDDAIAILFLPHTLNLFKSFHIKNCFEHAEMLGNFQHECHRQNEVKKLTMNYM